MIAPRYNRFATLDGIAVERALRTVPKALGRELTRGLNREGSDFIRTMKQDQMSEAGPASVGTRTGNLRRALKRTVVRYGPSPLDQQLMVYFDNQPVKVGPYAKALEYGARIRPKHKRFLTIPMPDNLTPAGVVRKTVADLKSDGHSFVYRKGDKAFIVEWVREGDRDGLVFRFQLVREVFIDDKLGLRITWRKRRTKQLRMLRTAFADAWASSKGGG